MLCSSKRAGTNSYGIEINTPVAALSAKQETEFHSRLRMWGLTAGPVTLREGNFVESPEVSEWIGKADVVLVNNYIFSSDRMCLSMGSHGFFWDSRPSFLDIEILTPVFHSFAVNDALTWRFLDLREGAKVVVLKPFWPLNRPLTERTVSIPHLSRIFGCFMAKSAYGFASAGARPRGCTGGQRGKNGVHYRQCVMDEGAR